MISRRLTVAVLLLCAGLAGCSGGKSNIDLQTFMDETRRRPGGDVEPLPAFRAYQSFMYSAATLRSPFDPPVKIIQEYILGKRSDLKPDLNRQKEYLEGFSLSSLHMVGTIKKDDTLWALVTDGQGGVHRVTLGNYMGKDHGKVVVTTPTQLTVVEIVSDGLDGWVERPKTLELKEKE